MSTPYLTSPPYDIGALYNRQRDIHAHFGGQQRGGIATPRSFPYIFLFTGEAGVAHGYGDFWDDESVFHYFGEGQRGDMRYVAGNRAILRHFEDGRRLLLFQSMGRGEPYRYLGEMRTAGSYEQAGVLDTEGNPRTAIVFRLVPVEPEPPFAKLVLDPTSAMGIVETVDLRLAEVRTKQDLFRRRLVTVEKHCRLTGVRDLRFVRASHIKPWAACATGGERIDGNNGLLLTPTADHLFDRGWISFESDGRLMRSKDLPADVADQVGFNLSAGRSCGRFLEGQIPYLEFHRHNIFQTRYKQGSGARDDLLKAVVG